MLIAESKTFTLGPYTVRQTVRPDNPYWPRFLIFRGEKLVGKSFSMPDLGCCKWLERQSQDRIVYADKSTPYRTFTIIRRGRPTNAERERRRQLEALSQAA